MSVCCVSSDCESNHPKKHRCPVNGQEYSEVAIRTIVHHIKESWNWVATAKHYYFCEDAECEVAYFGDDGSTILKSQLRTRIGLKERSDDGLLCYCFGISKADFQGNPATRDFVMAQTKMGLCSCAYRSTQLI